MSDFHQGSTCFVPPDGSSDAVLTEDVFSSVNCHRGAKTSCPPAQYAVGPLWAAKTAPEARTRRTPQRCPVVFDIKTLAADPSSPGSREVESELFAQYIPHISISFNSSDAFSLNNRCLLVTFLKCFLALSSAKNKREQVSAQYPGRVLLQILACRHEKVWFFRLPVTTKQYMFCTTNGSSDAALTEDATLWSTDSTRPLKVSCGV